MAKPPEKTDALPAYRAALSPKKQWEIYFGGLGFSAILLALFSSRLTKLGLDPRDSVINCEVWWIALAIGFLPPVFRLIKQMSPAHLVVMILCVGSFLVGHLWISSRATFPIMSWYIFTGPNDFDEVRCREMFGVFKDGKEKRLLVEQIFPSIVQFNLPIDSVDGKRSPSMPRIIFAIGAEYNRLHPDNPVIRVDLRELVVPVRPSSPEQKPSWTSLESYTISSDPSKS